MRASRKRRRVIGASRMRTPVACATAFATAAAVGTIGGSPSPREPTLGGLRIGLVDELHHDLGTVAHGRDDVVLEAGVHDGAGGRVDDALFREREPQRLQHAALDLACRGKRIDDAPDVVDGHDALDADLARRLVDRDLRDLAAEGLDAQALGVRPARSRADEAGVAELLRDLGDRPLQGAVRLSHLAAAQRQVARRDLEQSPGEREQLVAHSAGRRRARRGHGRRRHRAARDRARMPGTRSCRSRPAPLDRQAEHFGGDLREDGRHAGADVLRPGHDGRAPVLPIRTIACAGGPPLPHQICPGDAHARGAGRRATVACAARRDDPSPRARRRGGSRHRGASTSRGYR